MAEQRVAEAMRAITVMRYADIDNGHDARRHAFRPIR